MSISSTTRKAGPYTGTGSTTVFPFSFKVFQSSDVTVVKTDLSNVESTLVLNADYSVTLNANQNSNPGGSVTLLGGALASGFKLTMTSDVLNLQPTDLTNQGGFYPSVLNDALDRATIQIQQVQEQVDRSFKVALSSSVAAEFPPPVANDLIGWDSTGTTLANIDPGTIATIATYATAYCDVFVGNGITTSWTLTRNPAVLYNLDVSINGSSQEPTRDYTLAGTTFTMTTPPPIGARVVVKYKEGLPNYSGDSQDVRFVQDGTGARPQTVQSRLREVVYDTDFSTIQQAIDYCLSFNGDAPILEITQCHTITPGSPLIINRPTDTPSLSRGKFTIRGQGAQAGFAMYAASGSNFMFENALSGYSENVVFENIWFQSDHTGFSLVIKGEDFIRVSFNNCYFQEIGVTVCSIYLQTWYLTNCKFVSWNGPIMNAAAFYDVNIIGCQFESGNYVSSSGFTAYAASGSYTSSQKVTAVANLYENCTGPFMAIQNGCGVVVQGNYFELNSNQVLDFQQGTPNGVYVTGNSFDLGPLSTSLTYAPIIISRPNGFFGAGNYSNGTLYHFLNQMNDTGAPGGSWGHGDYTPGNGRILSTSFGVNGGTKTPGLISSIRPDAYEVAMDFGVGYGASNGELHAKTTASTRIGWTAKQTNSVGTYNNFSVKSDGTFAINLSTSGVTLDENATLAFFQASPTQLRITVKCSDGVTRTANITLT